MATRRFRLHCDETGIDTRNTFSTRLYRSPELSVAAFSFISRLADTAAPVLQKNYGTPINLISTESFPYDGRSRFLMICGEKKNGPLPSSLSNSRAISLCQRRDRGNHRGNVSQVEPEVFFPPFLGNFDSVRSYVLRFRFRIVEFSLDQFENVTRFAFYQA